MFLVHINKVEIFGFKSFGFKNTIIPFEPGIVSISGPNGSGKTNILDAIIFALGENRPKVMRVAKLRYLIHDIGENCRGPKMARSSVHFEPELWRITLSCTSVPPSEYDAQEWTPVMVVGKKSMVILEHSNEALM